MGAVTGSKSLLLDFLGARGNQSVVPYLPDTIYFRLALRLRWGPDLAGKVESPVEAATCHVKLSGLWKRPTSDRLRSVRTVGVCGLMADGLS